MKVWMQTFEAGIQIPLFAIHLWEMILDDLNDIKWGDNKAFILFAV